MLDYMAKATQEDVLLKTKPGCYLGILQEKGKERSAIFGELKRGIGGPSEKEDTVAFNSFVKFDLKTFTIKEVHKEGGVFEKVPAESFLLGQNLMHTLGGTEKTNELLDALGHTFSKEKYKEYLSVVKRAKQEEKEAGETREQERKKQLEATMKEALAKQGIHHPILRKVMRGAEKVGKGIGTGVLLGGTAYAWGYYPWSDKLNDKIDSTERLGIKGKLALPVLTEVINFVGGAIYAASKYTAGHHAGLLTHGLNPAYVLSVDPALFAFEVALSLPIATGVANGVYKGAEALVGAYRERKIKEANRRMSERVRQAFCPADSEKYYDA